MKLDWSSLIATLTADINKAPQILQSLQGVATLLETDAAAAAPLLTQFFPNLASVGPTIAAELKAVSGFLSVVAAKLPAILPYVLDGLALAEKFLPAASPAVKPPA